jgi:hypothetical protein
LDVFYYWKEFEENVEKGMLGRFVSSKDQLEKLKDRDPDYIWAFIIPKGLGGQRGQGNGQLKLIARLRWSNTPLPELMPTVKKNPRSEIYYDHKAIDSVLYENTHSVEALDLVTRLMRSKYPQAFKANFRGPNGIHIMEQDLVDKLNKETGHYSSTQFLAGIAKLQVLE